MKHQTAERVADLLMAAVAISVAWLVVRDPRGRRLAGGVVRRFLTTDAPRFLAREIRHAWEATA